MFIAPELRLTVSSDFRGATQAMRPIWKGALTFGLVNIPVQLYSAIKAGEKISFRLLHKADLSPVRYERVCQRDGDVVPWNDIVKGYEYTKGKFVVMTDEDFKAAALESSKQIEILDFVNAAEIDARYFETPYYLLPAKGGEKPYALLREAVRRTGMIGIGKITMRSNSHHLAGLRVVGDALVLEIMRFADELVDTGSFSFPTAESVRPQELQMAEQLIGNLSEPFDPSKYTDEYRAKILRIIRAKMKGRKIEVTEQAEPEATPVVDLMARLQASLASGPKPGRGARPAARTRQSARAGRS
ncbi:MAG TPA: Ku protein, partial [Gemmatimonadaceae bacterium]|nr:Ku protein [Gemmatimonadaceae bacterium]